jgi:hypothetical protein
MNKLTAVTILAAVPAIFAINAITAKPAKADEDCKRIAAYAESVMKVRQANAPLADALSTLDWITHEQSRRSLEQLIRGAYEQPVMRTEKEKAQAIIGYGTSTHLLCVLVQK